MKSMQIKKMAVAFIVGLGAVTAMSGAQAQSSSAASVPSAHNETVGARIEDGVLTSKVKTALLAAKGLDSTGIHVHSREGRVYLTGHVPSVGEKSLATETAQSVSGVQSVHTRLALRGRHHMTHSAGGASNGGAPSDATHGETDAH